MAVFCFFVSKLLAAFWTVVFHVFAPSTHLGGKAYLIVIIIGVFSFARIYFMQTRVIAFERVEFFFEFFGIA